MSSTQKACLYTITNKSNKSQIDEVMAYGNNEIGLLSSQFSEALPSSEAEVISEWSSYKQFMMENCTEMSLGQIITDLCTDTTKGRIFPNMTALAKICRVIPIHTGNVERTFSQLKLIKTRVRNRMNEKTLEALLRIEIEGPDVQDFPIGQAVELWSKKKNRRISLLQPCVCVSVSESHTVSTIKTVIDSCTVLRMTTPMF